MRSNSEQFTPKHPHMVLEAIEGQSYVVRYNTLPTLQDRQTVAAHIGRGALLMAVVVREISCTPMFNADMAYQLMAGFVIHDLGESMTGDVIGPTKDQVPEFDTYEETWMRAFIDHSLYIPTPPKDSIIPRVIKMVDYAEGTMYSMAEYKLGNVRFKNCLYTYLTALEAEIHHVEEYFAYRLESMDTTLRRGWAIFNKYKE